MIVNLVSHWGIALISGLKFLAYEIVSEQEEKTTARPLIKPQPHQLSIKAQSILAPGSRQMCRLVPHSHILAVYNYLSIIHNLVGLDIYLIMKADAKL